VCYLQLENGNLNKNALCQIESQCHADSKHIFESKIVQVVSEKNKFKVGAAFMRRRSFDKIVKIFCEAFLMLQKIISLTLLQTAV
jgi:hypothetical protein